MSFIPVLYKSPVAKGSKKTRIETATPRPLSCAVSLVAQKSKKTRIETLLYRG